MRVAAKTTCLLLMALWPGCSLDPFEPVVGGADASTGLDAAAADGGTADGGPGRDGGGSDAGDAGGEVVDAGFDAGLDGGFDAGFDACVARAETCDGADEDCDGRMDEDTARGCANACGAAGMETCVGGVYGPCDAPAPPRETCDGTDEDCDGTIDEDGGCPCPLLHLAGHAYLFCNTPMRWQEAMMRCDSLGYALTTIDDAAENTFVGDNALMMVSGRDWWIGYNDRAMEGRFEWVVPSTGSFTGWGVGQPDGFGLGSDCVEIAEGSGAGETRGRWDDDSCNDSEPFVCESLP